MRALWLLSPLVLYRRIDIIIPNTLDVNAGPAGSATQGESEGDKFVSTVV